MANSIAYAQKFVPIIDDIYKAASYTDGMDASVKPDFSGVNEVKVLKVSTTGLGDYSRSTGYPKGDVTAAWETFKLTEDRGKEFSIDRMDDEETLGMAFGEVTGKFMRDWVVPELDAYRFAKYASTEGISSAAATLTKDTIIAAFDEAVRQMDEDEVPREGRRLYVSSDLQPALNAAITRTYASDAGVNTALASYNNMPIIYVPKTRCYTAITMNTGVAEASGSASWGYVKASSAADINFMLIQPDAILQVVKFALPKVFTPDENQDKDMWKFQFRVYHDAFVYENKAKGVYLHKKEASE